MISLPSFHSFFLLFTLSVLELVLGIDNVIFISLVISKLPQTSRLSVRLTAFALAFLIRILLLWGLVSLSRLTYTLFAIHGITFNVRDILYFVGGIFLVCSTVLELKKHLWHGSKKKNERNAEEINIIRNNRSAIIQVVFIDILFSFDSIFAAIGLTQNLTIMATAIIIGMVCMVWLSGKVAEFIGRHRNLKTISLFFILMVGFILIADSIHVTVPRIWVYIPVGIALLFELFHLWLKKSR